MARRPARGSASHFHFDGDSWLERSTAAYLDQLRTFGIALGTEQASAMIADRVQRFAAATGLDRHDARRHFSEGVLRSWALEAGAQLGDEQPSHPAVALSPDAIAPLRLLTACLRASLSVGPATALGNRLAAAMELYPPVHIGGIALLRCPSDLLEDCSRALAGSPDPQTRVAAEQAAQLASAARRRRPNAGKCPPSAG